METTDKTSFDYDSIPPVSIQRISQLLPIAGSRNNQCTAWVAGKQTVVNKNEFNDGDFCVWHKCGVVVDLNRNAYERFRQQRAHAEEDKLSLKVSEGLALPIAIFAAELQNIDDLQQGFDVTDAVGARFDQPGRARAKPTSNVSAGAAPTAPVIKTVAEFKKCNAVEQFWTASLRAAEIFSIVRPENMKKLRVSHDKQAALFQQQFVSVWAIWESFLADLVDDAWVAILRAPNSNLNSSGSVSRVDKLEGPLRAAAKQSFIHKFFPDNTSEKQYPKIAIGVLDFFLEHGDGALKQLFNEHRDSARNCLGSPLFAPRDPSRGILTAFARLFCIERLADKEKFLAEFKSLLVSAEKPFQVHFVLLNPEDEKEVSYDVTITEFDVLNDVLRLFYGSRCSYAHGRNAETLSNSLAGFPNKAEDLHVGNLTVSQWLMDLYGQLLRMAQPPHGRRNQAQTQPSARPTTQRGRGRDGLTYQHLVNLRRFLTDLVDKLRVAVRELLRSHFFVDVWDSSSIASRFETAEDEESSKGPSNTTSSAKIKSSTGNSPASVKNGESVKPNRQRRRHRRGGRDKRKTGQKSGSTKQEPLQIAASADQPATI